MAQLVIQTAFLGDLLLSIPLLKRVRRNFPNSELHILCRKGFGPLLKQLQLVDVYHEVDKNSSESRTRLKKEMGGIEFENVFCPHESFRSALFVKGLCKTQSFGFRKWWNGFVFSSRKNRPMLLPDALRQLCLIEDFDAEIMEGLKEQLEVYIKAFDGDDFNESAVDFSNFKVPAWASMKCEVSENYYEEDLGNNNIVLAPGSVWNTKKWGMESYAELGKALIEAGFSVTLTGSSAEAELCAEIQSQLPGAKNLAGKTSLIETLAVLKKSKGLVCNDSGAMHLGSVVNIPTVAIFGPTTLGLGYRPWSNRAMVCQIKLDCRPCGLHGGKSCPIGTHECMKSVAVDSVFAALRKVLSVP